MASVRLRALTTKDTHDGTEYRNPAHATAHRSDRAPAPEGRRRTDTINPRMKPRTKLQTSIEAFAEKEQTIVASRVLSEEGKREELKKLATDRLPGFAWLGRVLTDIDANHERLQTQLFTVESPVENEVLRYFQAMEIRDDFGTPETRSGRSGVPPGRRNRSCPRPRGDARSPGATEVNQDVQHRGLSERAKRIMPTVYATYQQVTILREKLGGLRDHVALWLRGYSLDPAKIHDVLAGKWNPLWGHPTARLAWKARHGRKRSRPRASKGRKGSAFSFRHDGTQDAERVGRFLVPWRSRSFRSSHGPCVRGLISFARMQAERVGRAPSSRPARP